MLGSLPREVEDAVAVPDHFAVAAEVHADADQRIARGVQRVQRFAIESLQTIDKPLAFETLEKRLGRNTFIKKRQQHASLVLTQSALLDSDFSCVAGPVILGC